MAKKYCPCSQLLQVAEARADALEQQLLAREARILELQQQACRAKHCSRTLECTDG